MSDNLIVVSKLKKLVKELSGMNTSASISGPLNKLVAKELEKAIENAKRDRRRTVMERDFQFDDSFLS